MEDSDGYDDGDADYVPDDYEGPSTPGLWEEPNLPNIQETPTCDDESLKEKLENTSQKVTDYVPHQQEKSTPVDHMSIDDFGHQSISMTQGLEGVKETYYENAIEKEHGNDINTRDNWFKVQGTFCFIIWKSWNGITHSIPSIIPSSDQTFILCNQIFFF